jgi:hypothetical protein
MLANGSLVIPVAEHPHFKRRILLTRKGKMIQSLGIPEKKLASISRLAFDTSLEGRGFKITLHVV